MLNADLKTLNIDMVTAFVILELSSLLIISLNSFNIEVDRLCYRTAISSSWFTTCNLITFNATSKLKSFHKSTKRYRDFCPPHKNKNCRYIRVQAQFCSCQQT